MWPKERYTRKVQKHTCQTHREDLPFSRLFLVSIPFNVDELWNSFEVSDHYRDTARVCLLSYRPLVRDLIVTPCNAERSILSREDDYPRLSPR